MEANEYGTVSAVKEASLVVDLPKVTHQEHLVLVLKVTPIHKLDLSFLDRPKVV